MTGGGDQGNREGRGKAGGVVDKWTGGEKKGRGGHISPSVC